MANKNLEQACSALSLAAKAAIAAAITHSHSHIASDSLASLHQKERNEKTTNAEENLPASIMEKDTRWLKRAASPINRKAAKQKVLNGDLGGYWKHQLQQLAKRRNIGSKSREPPSPEGGREARVGLVGIWKHAAPNKKPKLRRQ
eukprot:1143796-Pelagomonas_calceolata.AAC.2